METFSALLVIWPVTRSFDVFFDLRLNNRFSKQSWGYRARYGVIVIYLSKQYRGIICNETDDVTLLDKE